MIVPTHKELNTALGQPAFIHPDEIEVLCRYAAQSYALLEIGCAWGASTTLFLLNKPTAGWLVSIDPFVTDPQYGWAANEWACRSAVAQAVTHFNHPATVINWWLYALTSAAAHDSVALGEIDLLYIDGDHSEYGVTTDFDLWTPQLKSAGVLLLHDSRRFDGYPDTEFARGWPAPTALANHLRADDRWELLEEVFSLTVWRKR